MDFLGEGFRRAWDYSSRVIRGLRIALLTLKVRSLHSHLLHRGAATRYFLATRRFWGRPRRADDGPTPHSPSQLWSSAWLLYGCSHDAARWWPGVALYLAGDRPSGTWPAALPIAPRSRPPPFRRRPADPPHRRDIGGGIVADRLWKVAREARFGPCRRHYRGLRPGRRRNRGAMIVGGNIRELPRAR